MEASSDNPDIVIELALKNKYHEIAKHCITRNDPDLWERVLGDDCKSNFPDLDKQKVIDEMAKILPNITNPSEYLKVIQGLLDQRNNIDIRMGLIEILDICLFGENDFIFKANRNLETLICELSIQYAQDRIFKYLNACNNAEFSDLAELCFSPVFNLTQAGLACIEASTKIEQSDKKNQMMQVIVNNLRDVKLAQDYFDKYGQTNEDVQKLYTDHINRLNLWHEWKTKTKTSNDFVVSQNMIDNQVKLLLAGFIKCIEKEFENENIIIPSVIIELCLLYFYETEYFMSIGFGINHDDLRRTLIMHSNYDDIYRPTASFGSMIINSMNKCIYKWKFDINLFCTDGGVTIGICDNNFNHWSPFKYRRGSGLFFAELESPILKTIKCKTFKGRSGYYDNTKYLLTFELDLYKAMYFFSGEPGDKDLYETYHTQKKGRIIQREDLYYKLWIEFNSPKKDVSFFNEAGLNEYWKHNIFANITLLSFEKSYRD